MGCTNIKVIDRQVEAFVTSADKNSTTNNNLELKLFNSVEKKTKQ